MTGRRAMITLCVWLLLSIALWASRSRPAVVLLAGIVAILAAVIVVTLDLGRAIVPVEWSRRPRWSSSSQGVDPWVISLRNQLDQGRHYGSTELRERLVDLIDDRLLVHHHVDRTIEPAAAMGMLSPTLRAFVEGPAKPVTSLRILRRIVTEIEAL
ncbi:MAG: hypothetical protein ABI862_09665 [Ilumatobacteraceae bacterium]